MYYLLFLTLLQRLNPFACENSCSTAGHQYISLPLLYQTLYKKYTWSLFVPQPHMRRSVHRYEPKQMDSEEAALLFAQAQQWSVALLL